MSYLLQTTIAGSLPKPSWLSQPNTLWAPWLLQGDALDQGNAGRHVRLDDDPHLDRAPDRARGRDDVDGDRPGAEFRVSL